MKPYKVKNVSQTYLNYKYNVVRYVDREYWYYGGYNDLVEAQNVATEIGNGIVVESNSIDIDWYSPPIDYDYWK